MCDFDEFGNDDFDADDFMDYDSLEDEYHSDTEMGDPLDGGTELENETDPAVSKDAEFTASDAFIVGGAMGYAYHEGMRERRRRKRKRFRDG